MKYRGVVIKGESRGTEGGFPSANIVCADASVSGIYVGEVRVNSRAYPAAVYADRSRGILEAHLLDFSEDVYGKEIEIDLLEKIREDQKFNDAHALHKAIEGDIQKVRDYFKE
jgi:riboflavin kinase/FMN adenylyltransferase